MSEASDRLRQLAKVGRAVNRKHGMGSVLLKVKPAPIPRISFGSLSLDTVTGGGLPVGRITLLWGHKSSGKTYLGLRVVANSQNLCANCLRPARIDEIREVVDPETGEVFYSAVGFCDCYAKGLWQPRPTPHEKTDKGGLKTCEVEGDVDSGPHEGEGGLVGNEGPSEPTSSASVADNAPEVSASTTGARRAAKKRVKRAAKKVRRKVGRKASAAEVEQGAAETAAEPLAATLVAGEPKAAQRGTQEPSKGKKTARKKTVRPDKKRKSTLYAERLARMKVNSYEEFRVMWIDLERAFDSVWAERVGVDVRRLVLHVPSTAEEAIDAHDAMLRTGAIDLAVIDSIAHMTPSDEVEISTEEWRQGLMARLMNKHCRKAVSAVTDTYRDYGRAPTQIWINQTRATMSQFGAKEVRPAGKGQDFANSLEIKQWSHKYDVEKIESDGKKDDEMSLGVRVRIHCDVQKNRTFPGGGSCSFVLNVRTGQIEDDDFIIARCESCGILRKAEKGSKWLCFDQAFSTKKDAVKLLLGSERNRVRGFLLENMVGAVLGGKREEIVPESWGIE